MHIFRIKIILILFMILIMSSAFAGADHWQGWRGLKKQACSDTNAGPVNWNASDNILWKVNIEGEGYSSPVVSESSVFITSAKFSNGNSRLNTIIICLLITSALALIIRNLILFFRDLRTNHDNPGNSSIAVVSQAAAYGLMAFCFCITCWMCFNENRSQSEWVLVSYFFSAAVTLYCLFFLVISFTKGSSLRIIGGISIIVCVILLLNNHPIPEFFSTNDFFRLENLWIFQLIVPAVVLPILFSLFILVEAFVFKNHRQKAVKHDLTPPGKQSRITRSIQVSAFIAFFLGLSGFMAIPVLSLAKWLNRDAFVRIQPSFSLDVFLNPEYSYPFFLSVISAGFLLLVLIDRKGDRNRLKNQGFFHSAVFCISLIFFILLNYFSPEPGYIREIICIDRLTGKIMWKKECLRSPAVISSNYNSQATPTPLIDNDNIYAYFGSAGFVGLDKTNLMKWENKDLPFECIHGVGASPVLCKDGIVVLNSMAKNPYLTLIDTETGNPKWRTNLKPYEGEGGEYRTPLVWEIDGNEVILEWSSARAEVVIYDAKTGRILFQYKTNWTTKGESVSTPVISDGVMFLPDKSCMVAFDILKLSRGESPIIWKTELKIDGPETSSPVLANGMLFMISDNGTASCLNSKTGEILWQKRLNGNYFSSPVSIGDRIYFSNTAGMTKVIQCSSQFRLLAENILPEGIYSTLVPVDGELFIRSKNTLWCIKQ
jgi:outer membrane protein assembly factor BamB